MDAGGSSLIEEYNVKSHTGLALTSVVFRWMSEKSS